MKTGIALSLYSDVVLLAKKAAKAGDSGNAMAPHSFIPLLYPPSEDARATLKIEIELCKHESNQNEAIYDLGDMYFE